MPRWLAGRGPADPADSGPVGRKHPDGHFDCRRCGYSWLPKTEGRDPKKCPRCWAWLDKPARPARAEARP